ncbi:ABC transporter permease [Bacillaceae bacterium]
MKSERNLALEPLGGQALAVPKSKVKRLVQMRLRRSGLSLLLGGGVVMLLLITWEIVSLTGLVDPKFASSPSRVLETGAVMLKSGEIWQHIFSSGKIFVVGYLLAVAVGVPAGILLGWFPKVRMAFVPTVAALNSMPRIAFMPLFIIWFGLGFGSKVALVFMSAVIPIIINMQMAMRSVDNDLTKVAKAYGANRRQIFLTVALPMSVPFLMTALQIAIGRALLGVVVAEVFGGSEGLGYMIQYAGATFQTDKVFVCVIIIAALGIAMDRILMVFNRRFDAWRGND